MIGGLLLDGSEVEIGHLAVNTARATLGVWVCPIDDPTA